MKLGWLSVSLLASSLVAQLPAVHTHGDEVPHGTIIPLWEGQAPGAVGTTEADKPQLEFFGASSEGKLKDGLRTAVIVCPGGGYTHLAYDKEGTRIAEWLNLQGVSAFVLTYRLGPRYLYPAPVLDGERAVRWVRAHAQEYGVSPDRIGVWGFSAGGHLVGVLGTRFDAGKPDANDPVERVSDRPDFAITSGVARLAAARALTRVVDEDGGGGIAARASECDVGLIDDHLLAIGAGSDEDDTAGLTQMVDRGLHGRVRGRAVRSDTQGKGARVSLMRRLGKTTRGKARYQRNQGYRTNALDATHDAHEDRLSTWVAAMPFEACSLNV